MTRIAVEWPGVGNEERYENAALARIEDALDVEFAGRISPQQIAATVAAARVRLRDVPLREYVPVMVERQARAELTAMAAGTAHGRAAP